jgi:triacylglycerol esterase/lipase EstA (alpha/beta hydrolase family)
MKRLGLLLIVTVLFTGCLPRSVHSWYADYKGDVDETYMVQDARNRILSYDWYYDQYAQIEAQTANLSTIDRTASEYDGMVRVVNSMIGEYNARSRQYNHNLWKANDLPYQIDYYKGE